MDYRIRINGEAFTPTAENTSLYSFAGDLAMYNHAFIQSSDKYHYVFEQSQNAGTYKILAEAAVAQEFQQILNLRTVPECDVAAYTKLAVSDLPNFDHVPQDWI